MAPRSTDDIDWFRIVSDLQRRDYSLRKTCRTLNRSAMTVHGWANGTEPRHRDGEALIRLWCEATGNVRDSAPRIGQNRPRPALLNPAKEAIP